MMETITTSKRFDFKIIAPGQTSEAGATTYEPPCILSYFILSYLISSHLIVSHLILSYHILSYLILSHRRSISNNASLMQAALTLAV
jgi:hypothetical protein